MQKYSSKFLLGLLFFALILSYQNCGEGFVIDSTVASNTSASCSAKLASERFDTLIFNKQIECDDLNKIVCDNSIFSPDVQNGKQSTSVCDVSKDITGCVRLNIYYFNTSQVRNSEQSSILFEEGGSYNQIESRCTLLDSSGFPIDTQIGSSLNAALKNLIKKCKEKVDIFDI